MSALTLVLSIALPIVSLAIAVWVGFRFMKKTGSGKIAFRKHFLTLAVALVLCLSLTMAVSAAGGDAGAAGDAGTASESADAADSGAGIATGLGFIGAALSIDLAAVGAGIALSAGPPRSAPWPRIRNPSVNP